MIDKRLFSENPEFGIKEWFYYDDDTNTCRIETVQDVEGLLDANVEEQNHIAQSGKRWGEWARVASVPMAIYGEWLTTGKDKDKRWLKRWLNDRENRKFRTRLGRV